MKYLVVFGVICFFSMMFATAGWKASLIFVGCLCGIVGIALAVKASTGAHAYDLESWKYEPGETVLWQDDAADTFLLAKTGQAVVMTFPRFHRDTVVVTNRRIIVAQKSVFSSKHFLRYIFYPGQSPDGNTEHLGGGAITVGYQSVPYEPGVKTINIENKYPRIELMPLAGHAGSTNLAKLFIYSDRVATFPLP